jgi:hypothetical protein
MGQKELLDLYSDYLLASFGATTATGLSDLVEGQVSHDQVTRHLSGERKSSADLWRVVKPFVRQVQNAPGVLIIDDSIEEKPYPMRTRLCVGIMIILKTSKSKASTS